MINLPNLSSMERHLHKLELVLERFDQPFFSFLKHLVKPQNLLVTILAVVLEFYVIRRF